MQPPPGMQFPGFGPKQPAPKDPPKEAPDVHKSAGAFGTEFPWVRAGERRYVLADRVEVIPLVELVDPGGDAASIFKQRRR